MDSKKRLYDNRLLVGPQSTWKDLKRSVQIGAEFFYGFRKLRHVKKCVTIFGSSRFAEDNPYHQMAEEFAY